MKWVLFQISIEFCGHFSLQMVSDMLISVSPWVIPCYNYLMITSFFCRVNIPIFELGRVFSKQPSQYFSHFRFLASLAKAFLKRNSRNLNLYLGSKIIGMLSDTYDFIQYLLNFFCIPLTILPMSISISKASFSRINLIFHISWK